MRHPRKCVAVFQVVAVCALLAVTDGSPRQGYRASKRKLNAIRNTGKNSALAFDPDSVDVITDSMFRKKPEGPNTWEGADIKLGRSQEPEQQQQQEGGVEEEAGATIHNRLNHAMQERGPVIRASVRSRESLQNRIRDSPMLAKLASMGAAKPQQLQVARRTSRRGKEMKPIVDPATGLYINKEKPSMHQAVKRSRTISKKNVPLAVDWGDGIDPPHAPKDYVAAPEKMAQRRAKIIAERGGPNAAVPYPPPEPKNEKKKEKVKKVPENKAPEL